MKPRCMLTVDVEALTIRAEANHVDTLIYGRFDGREYGIGKLMDIADKHNVKMTFFVDFAECELYGDEILEVGRYILSRGHDMQVHCHYNFLEKIVGKPAWVSMTENYRSWYDNYEDSQKIIDYVTDKYMECTGRMPLAYRGGEYRFGIGILKALKEKGYQADLSYNFVRPRILKSNREFLYENGLLELPLGILPQRKPLNFNYSALIPQSYGDFDRIISEYNDIFNFYYDYYGNDSISSMLFHSWSFLNEPEHLKETGHFDQPQDIMVAFYDYFLEKFKDKIDFVTATEALEAVDTEKLKIADFNAIINKDSSFSYQRLAEMNDFIKERSGGRNVVIWGKGWIESTIFQTFNFHETLNTAYYISNDADKLPKWRGRPVHKFSEVSISPEQDYVFVVAQASFSDIRDSLRELGFKEFADYYDIQKPLYLEKTNGIKSESDCQCPICGGSVFETFNSCKPRRCIECGSVERTRTIPKLLDENIGIDFFNSQILHVSPSNPERRFFRTRNANVTTIDIRPECRVDIVADICDMPEVEAESFDVVFACCVLNHVYDDEKALEEICRVLKKGGIALFWVLDSGSLKTTCEDDPTKWYGKENYDKYRIGTFRLYGEVDFTGQLRRHFPKVRCYEKYDEVTDSSCKWYCCMK